MKYHTLIYMLISLIFGIGVALSSMLMYNVYKIKDLIAVTFCGIFRNAILGYLIWQYINLY